MFQRLSFAGLATLASAVHNNCLFPQEVFDGVTSNGTTFNDVHTTSNATAPCNDFRQLFFKYSPTSTGKARIRFDVGMANTNRTDKLISVWNGTCPTLVGVPSSTTFSSTGVSAPDLTCKDDGSSGEEIFFDAVAMSNVTIAVGKYSESNNSVGYGYFDFETQVATEGKSTCSAAVRDISMPGLYSSSNLDPVNTVNAVAMIGATQGYNTVWFKYISTCTGNVTASFDTWAGGDMYTGIYQSCSPSATCDGSPNPTCTFTDSDNIGTIDVKGGQTYYIAIGGYGSTTRDAFTLTVGACNGVPGGSPTAAGTSSALAQAAVSVFVLAFALVSF